MAQGRRENIEKWTAPMNWLQNFSRVVYHYTTSRLGVTLQDHISTVKVNGRQFACEMDQLMTLVQRRGAVCVSANFEVELTFKRIIAHEASREDFTKWYI